MKDTFGSIYILNVAIIATLTVSKITVAEMAVAASKRQCNSIGAKADSRLTSKFLKHFLQFKMILCKATQNRTITNTAFLSRC